MKFAPGQIWCVRAPGNRAYFLVTRHSEERRGWIALTLSLGVGWKPWSDGIEVLFHAGDLDTDVSEGEHLELVCDVPCVSL